MKIETIKCDCCLKELKPMEYCGMTMQFKEYGSLLQLPNDIDLTEVCQSCAFDLHKLIERFMLVDARNQVTELAE